MIKKYNINIPESEINDLKDRINNTRWPNDPFNEDWVNGTNKDFLKDFLNYWANDYDWRKAESKINELGSYIFKSKENIDIHFIHTRSDVSESIPILFTHGWPGSIQEFLKITKILSHSTKYNFSIVCPSIPGFGFSGKPDKKGFNSEKIAHIWHELMLELGYKKYIVQGGDWGATISKWIAELYPDSCIGLHLNLVIAYPPDKDPFKDVSEKELKLLENYEKYKTQGFGYYEIQKTKPQSLGYGLTDSPAGLAGWIVEKYFGWFNDNDNNLVATTDEVLSIISLYWFSNSINSSLKLYKENGDFGFSFNKISVPTAGAIFKKDIMIPPKKWAEEIYNLIQWNVYDGGHFAALEKPEILAKDLEDFVDKLEI